MTRKLAGEHFEWQEGTHLFPMERPDETAAAVLRFVVAMQGPMQGRPPDPRV